MIDRLLEAICAALLVATVSIAFIAVVFRYGIGSSLSWSFEASLILLTYLTFIGAYLAMRKNAHLKVEVMVAKLPLTTQLVVFTFNQSVIFLIAFVMVYHGGRQVLLFQTQTTLILEFPVGILYAVIPLCGLLFALQGMVDLIAGIKRWRQGIPVFDKTDAPVAADI